MAWASRWLPWRRPSPKRNFIGIEVHKPGVGKLLHSMAEHGVDNIRIYCHDAVEILRDCIPDASLDTVQIFFPDPWHKKRHNKRRLIQPSFVALLIAQTEARAASCTWPPTGRTMRSR